jgi:Ser/Thr protein kinase RdoA (MazF antagonist)
MERVPTYQPGDVIESRDGRQLEVLSVGQEAYFLRRLDWAEGDCEPRETAWEIAGCEDATWLTRATGQP